VEVRDSVEVGHGGFDTGADIDHLSGGGGRCYIRIALRSDKRLALFLIIRT
jgi:hypothetical protein